MTSKPTYEELESRIQELEHLNQIEHETLKEKETDAENRARELNCLLEISKLSDQFRVLVQELHQGIVDIILKSWQYPEITCVRLILADKEVVSRNFKNTPWKLTRNVMVYGENYGRLVIGYLEEKPAKEDGPFTTEEKELIAAITKRLGKVLERKLAEEKLLTNEKQFRYLIENSLTAISIIQDEELVYRNSSSIKLTGYLKDASLSSVFEKIHPDDVMLIIQKYEYLTGGKIDHADLNFRFYPEDEAGVKLEMKSV